VNAAEIRAGVVAAIQDIAPEVDAGELIDDRPLRNQVDLDSIDWLNVIIGFHERFGIEVPEADYARLGTLNEIVAYLGDHLAC
jgi:acyl carrier protein